MRRRFKDNQRRAIGRRLLRNHPPVTSLPHSTVVNVSVQGIGSPRGVSMSPSVSGFPLVPRRTATAVGVAVCIAPFFALALGAQPPAAVPTIPDSALLATSTTIGGAPVLPTTRTVAHWWGSTTDPHDGVTYG